MTLRKIETWALDRVLRDEKSFLDLPPESVVFRRDDPGSFMAVVMRGAVGIRRDGAEIAVVEAGSVFGEMALIDGQPRSADAVTKTHCRLALIDDRHFKALVRDTPEFALSLMKILVERLRAHLES